MMRQPRAEEEGPRGPQEGAGLEPDGEAGGVGLDSYQGMGEGLDSCQVEEEESPASLLGSH